jgi:hypothetical protein
MRIYEKMPAFSLRENPENIGAENNNGGNKT